MFTFNIDLSTITKSINDLFNIDKRIAYNDVGILMLNAITTQFEQEGAYFNNGNTWEQLAPATIRERKRLDFYPIHILRRRAGDAGLLGSIHFSVTDYGIEVGTNLFYAKFLQEGTKYMPARPFFPSSDIPQILMDDIASVISSIFFN